jgi:uncharacterized membrane protein YfcA
MLGLRGFVYVALAAFGSVFSATWWRQIAEARRTGSSGDPATDAREPGWTHTAIGFVTNFFDTLGIGSFATTTAVYRLLRLVPDRFIPGTLLVGHSFPTFAQAFIYITIIEVEMKSLVLLVGASVVGSWLGAGVVAGWPKRKIQLGMGAALLGAALVMVARLTGMVPAGGEALGLSGLPLVLGLVGNFVLGALMTIGIGAYAPSLIMFGLLGMNTKSIFPIMMGSCAFLMPVGGIQFIRRRCYDLRASVGLALGGVPAVLLAAYAVKSLPLDVLKWLVLVVVVYTGVTMLRSALRPAEPTAETPPAPTGAAT